jgi:hypothetical protein
LFLFTLLFPAPSFPWGPAGHQIVALIAEDNLNPRAKSMVQAILGPGKNFVDEADWADRIKHYKPETKPWHYINLPVSKDVTAANLSKFCGGDECILPQIEKDIAILKDPSILTREKRDALRYLEHFVGDLHMPLHCAENGEDEGGNLIRVWFQGHWTSLHTLWDRLLRQENPKYVNKIAELLEEGITPAHRRAWTNGTPEEWALESYRIAKDTLYPDYWKRSKKQGKKNIDLPQSYVETMQPIVDEQLVKAGLRLAYLLNNLKSK